MNRFLRKKFLLLLTLVLIYITQLVIKFNELNIDIWDSLYAVTILFCLGYFSYQLFLEYKKIKEEHNTTNISVGDKDGQ